MTVLFVVTLVGLTVELFASGSFAVTVKVLSAVAPVLSLIVIFTLYVPAVVGLNVALVAVPNSVPTVVHALALDSL